MTYIMVWVEERETWHYFIDEFDESLFPHGYTDYYVTVEFRRIIEDTYNSGNVGKRFDDCYSLLIGNER